MLDINDLEVAVADRYDMPPTPLLSAAVYIPPLDSFSDDEEERKEEEGKDDKGEEEKEEEKETESEPDAAAAETMSVSSIASWNSSPSGSYESLLPPPHPEIIITMKEAFNSMNPSTEIFDEVNPANRSPSPIDWANIFLIADEASDNLDPSTEIIDEVKPATTPTPSQRGTISGPWGRSLTHPNGPYPSTEIIDEVKPATTPYPSQRGNISWGRPPSHPSPRQDFIINVTGPDSDSEIFDDVEFNDDRYDDEQLISPTPNSQITDLGLAEEPPRPPPRDRLYSTTPSSMDLIINGRVRRGTGVLVHQEDTRGQSVAGSLSSQRYPFMTIALEDPPEVVNVEVEAHNWENQRKWRWRHICCGVCPFMWCFGWILENIPKGERGEMV